MKIDIYSHFITKKLVDAFFSRVGNLDIISMRPDNPFNIQAMCDVDKRIEILQKFPGVVQVLTPTGQPIECLASPQDTIYLTKLYNDELAELVNKYPKQFIAAIATIPINDIDGALKEIDRAINELGFKGILLSTPVNGKPMDLPEFMPVYECMASYNLPIWIHPSRFISFPDYVNEKTSKYGIHQILGWPYETSVAMCRLACSGILEKYPNLKFISHHAGAMIPFFAGRVLGLNPLSGQEILSEEELRNRKSPIDQLRSFYVDTAIFGNKHGLMCSHDFFGAEHMLFGTDIPYGPGLGEQYLRANIEAIDNMDISEDDRKKIYAGNAKALLQLNKY